MANDTKLPPHYAFKLQAIKNDINRINDIEVLRTLACQMAENTVTTEHLMKQLMKVDAAMMRASMGEGF